MKEDPRQLHSHVLHRHGGAWKAELSGNCPLGHLYVTFQGLGMQESEFSHRSSHELHGALSTQRVRYSKESSREFQVQPWKSQNVTSAAFYWSRKSITQAQIQVEENWTQPLNGKNRKQFAAIIDHYECGSYKRENGELQSAYPWSKKKPRLDIKILGNECTFNGFK